MGISFPHLPNPFSAVGEVVRDVGREAKGRAESILSGFQDFLDKAPRGTTHTVEARDPRRSELERMRSQIERGMASRGEKAQKGKALPFDVVTFNTACGNPDIKVKQRELPQLPVYQKVIRGEADAPIMALQEVGPAQSDELKRLAKNGNFTVVEAETRYSQRNVLLIPKRFEVVDVDSSPLLKGHLRGVADSLWGKLRHGEEFAGTQLGDLRMATGVKLRDRLSGKEFTVFNTHVSYDPNLRHEQMKELLDRVHSASKGGPVILAGDLNLPTQGGSSETETDRNLLQRAGLQDLGPERAAPGEANIDYVLGKGFDPVSSHYLLDLKLPSAPTADKVSDHPAEQNRVRLK